LHDDGDSPDQLNRVMPWLSLQNYVGVAPRAGAGNMHHGYYWEQTLDSIEHACEVVQLAIDKALMRVKIAKDRIYIAGSGNAGTMAIRVAMDRPEFFKGVVSINGPLPQGLTPLSKLQQCRQIEVFWAHCRKSKSFPEPELCQQLTLLHSAGFSTTLRQYPCGDRQIEIHDRHFNPLGDLNRWIMSGIESSVA
jgi:phospholipase/carboxylesterase